MEIIKFCKKYILNMKISYTIYCLLTLLVTIVGILISVLSGEFIDNLIIKCDFAYVIHFCLIFIILTLLSLICNVISNYLGVKIQTTAGFILNKDLLDYLKLVSISYTKNIDAIYLNQRINNDANEVVIFCINVIVQSMINFFTFIATALILLKINYTIAYILFLLVFLYFITYRIFRKRIYLKSLELKEAQSNFFSKLSEHITNIQFIKSHAIDSLFSQRLITSFSDTLSKVMLFQKVSYMFSSCDTIVSTIAVVLVYMLGGIEILHGDLTIGYFTIIISMFNSMVSSVKYFLGLGQDYQDTLVSFNRIKEILSIPRQQHGNHIINDIKKIELKNFTFHYGDRKIFDNFSLTFGQGKIYCIIGTNGTGKSTLIDNIMGLYLDEYEGRIEINEYELHDIDLVSLRQNCIGLSEQEAILLSGTINENIKMFEQKDIDEVRKYTCIMGLNNYIEKLENGYNTLINPQTNNISGGERQKISIIRQLAQNPEVMIFDEPTSALDIESKKDFINYLQTIKKDKIIIVVTHDKDLKEASDIQIQI